MNDSRPWWLWPNLLGLDAPAVAVSWQVFLASAAGVAVPRSATVVLALVVWAIYLADRALDAHRGADGTDRHRAAGRNPTVWAATAGGALASAVAFTFLALPRAYFIAGLSVAAATFGYFAAVHLLRVKSVLDRGAKEASVGVVFAAGVAIPLVAEAGVYAEWLPGVVAFAALCWLNCTLISIWEEGAATAPPLWTAGLAAGVAAIAAVGAAPVVAVAVFASTAALVALHALRGYLSVRLTRVLADVVLLTPLVVAVWL